MLWMQIIIQAKLILLTYLGLQIIFKIKIDERKVAD